MTVVSTTFAEQARLALQAQDDPADLKRAAADCLHETTRRPVAAADTAVQSVIDMAGRLDAAHDRQIAEPAPTRRRTTPQDAP